MWVLLMAYKLFDSNGKYQIVFLTSSYHITQNNEVTQHTFNPYTCVVQHFPTEAT